MKKFALLTVALSGLFFANHAQAATPGRTIAQARLSEMGLESMQALSDVEGLQVRGKGARINITINQSVHIRGNNNQVANVVGINSGAIIIFQYR